MRRNRFSSCAPAPFRYPPPGCPAEPRLSTAHPARTRAGGVCGCVGVCMSVYECMGVCRYMDVDVYRWCMDVRMDVRMDVCMDVCMDVYGCVNECMSVCMCM